MLIPLIPVKANDNAQSDFVKNLKKTVDASINQAQEQVLNHLLWAFNQTSGCEKAAQIVRMMMTTLQLQEETKGE